MTFAALDSTPTERTAAWPVLARIEATRYARRPAFLIGAALTYAALLPYLNRTEPTDELSMIAPAALIGLVGISVSASRVRASDRCAEAAGPTAVGQRQRTLAHLIACLVPFLTGTGFVAITLVRSRSVPTPADGYAVMMSDSWVAAVWIALGAVSCLGGPVLGVVIARRWRWSAAPLVASVGLVILVIVFQGLFPVLRRVRVAMPWTYWGGPFGVDGDPERSIVLPGSPGWWLVYLLALCLIGAVVAVRADPDARDGRTAALLVAASLIAAISCGLAMWTGTPATLVGPVAGQGTSWGG